MEEGEAIEHKMVTNAIERAQKQVEGHNFSIRKHLLEYDDVMNKQREAIYHLRREIQQGNEGRDYVLRVARDVLDYMLDTHCPEKADPRDWNLTEVSTDMLAYFNVPMAEVDLDMESLGVEELRDALWNIVETKYTNKETRLGSELTRMFERDVMLRVVDASWKDHLLALDHLKEGIGLRGYGQRDPKQEYKKESFELFQAMKERVEDTAIKTLFRLTPVSAEQMAERNQRRQAAPAENFRLSAPPKASQPTVTKPMVRKQEKVGRNQPCPCGSGKKFKKCHGATARV